MPTLHVELIEDVPSPIPAEELRLVLQRTFDEWGSSEAMVEILLTTDERMRVLNHQHRGKDTTTDVLSLPITIDTEHGRVVPESDQPSHLGTIVISLEQARRQVGHFGATTPAEILGLAGHGLRHLLGHAHDQEGRWQTP
ncbi:rRNA maturation RNase YbeY [Candidatus Berkelbacteria bacterium]|nr:rRNA maturation RNase YbeY [Candidatus Berkelbacteria bacterium]